MANDTKYIVNDTQMTSIASAVRNKLGEQDTYNTFELPGKIEDIVTIPYCTVTVNNTSNENNLNLHTALNWQYYWPILYNPSTKLVFDESYISEEVYENGISPSESQIIYVLNTVYYDNSNEKGGTRTVTTEFPQIYLGIALGPFDSDDYTDIIQNLNNVSVRVVSYEYPFGDNPGIIIKGAKSGDSLYIYTYLMLQTLLKIVVFQYT